jgi:hypothetical protein
MLSGVGIYVRDLRLGRTYRADVGSDGQPARLHAVNGDFDSQVLYPTISADGRYVAMFCSNCVSVKPTANLMVYDRTTGAAQPIPCPASEKRAGGDPAGMWNCDWAPQISADGKHVSLTTYWTPTTPLPDYVGSADAFTWNRGPAVGTGRLAAGGASAALRPQLHDVYVRVELRSLPSVAGRPVATGLMYGVDLTAGGTHYEVRYDGSSFGLFRADHGQWREVTTLRGGFGTTGVEMVFAVPLAALGNVRGLSDLRAFAGTTSSYALPGRPY